MKKQILSLAIASAILVMTGCVIEPHVFGIPQSQWNSLTTEQQQEVIRGYNEMKNTELQVAPLHSAVGVASDYLKEKNKRDVQTDQFYSYDLETQALERQQHIIKQQQRDLRRQRHILEQQQTIARQQHILESQDYLIKQHHTNPSYPQSQKMDFIPEKPQEIKKADHEKKSIEPQTISSTPVVKTTDSDSADKNTSNLTNSSYPQSSKSELIPEKQHIEPLTTPPTFTNTTTTNNLTQADVPDNPN